MSRQASRLDTKKVVSNIDLDIEFSVCSRSFQMIWVFVRIKKEIHATKHLTGERAKANLNKNNKWILPQRSENQAH